MSEPQNRGNLEQPQWIAYLDLSGGRNTKKDPHALDRNQLVQSDNTWMQTGNALSKRPGSISIPGISAGTVSMAGPSVGTTGSGVAAIAMVGGRFFEETCLVVQGNNNWLYAAPLALPAVSSGPNVWVSIGQVSGGTIQATQLYDPDPTSAQAADGALFITDGIDTPKWWVPGSALTATVTSQLPTKKNSTLPITPKYCATLFGSIFYAGEPTDPNAVYISNPLLPQQFTVNTLTTTGNVTTNTFVPAWIGRGDGFNGGAITGMAVMGSAMIVYKESAIYALTQVGILGDSVWGSTVVSSSVGNLSPSAIVAFDTFHVFLGIDGVYTFDGLNTVRVSENNPDLFDGPTAQILNRTTAVAVRYGTRYLIWYDNGGGTGIPLGYPCAGVWFDFGKPDADGFPTVGTISNMNVSGVVALRGPNDTGNFAWADAVLDRVGEFNAVVAGEPVYTDFGTNFTVTVQGKADYFADIWADEAPLDVKNVDNVSLLMSFPIVASSQSYTFSGQLTLDNLTILTSQQNSNVIPNISGPIVGQAQVGNASAGPTTAVLGLTTGTPAYQYVTLFQPQPAEGYIIQWQFQETGPYPWTSLGFLVNANRQRRVGMNSG